MNSLSEPLRRSVTRTGATLVAAGVVALCAPWPGASWADPGAVSAETRAAAYIRPAIVSVTSTIPDQVVAHCTGFVVNPDGYIATAGHCVDPRHMSDDALSADDGAKSEVLDQIEQTGMTVSVVGAGMKATPARVVDVHPAGQGDVALLKVAVPNLPSSQLSTATPQVGASVQSVGYAAPADVQSDWTPDPSVDPTTKSGTISGLATVGTAPAIEVSSPMVKGMSGGPTVDSDGMVIGINSLGTKDSDSFNYVSAVSELAEMMKSNGVTSQMGPADPSYRQGVDAYLQGDYKGAMKGFDAALGVSPTYPKAFAMRTDSALRVQQGGGASTTAGVPTWLVAGAGCLVALAAFGGIGYYIYTHRGKKSGSGVPADAIPAGSVPQARPPVPVHAGGPQPHAQAAPPAPSGASARCSNCGFELPPGQAFCGRCGRSQE